jgi:hypothetical protein
MSDDASRFKNASQQDRRPLLAELLAFVMENKKWWLLPIIAAMLLVGALVVLGSSGAAPFIYTLF